MAKNIVCEVLTTLKGLDLKKPSEHIHAGTADKPTLIEMADNAVTTSLIKSGALRIYPGPQAVSNLPESDKVNALKGKIAELEKALEDAGKAAVEATAAAEALTVVLQLVAADTDLETAVNRAKEALD